MASLAERLLENEAARTTRTQREEAKLEAESEAPAQPKKKKKKKKPVEKVGTGTSSFNLDGAIAKMQAQIAASTDPDFKARLKARIQALKDNQ